MRSNQAMQLAASSRTFHMQETLLPLLGARHATPLAVADVVSH